MYLVFASALLGVVHAVTLVKAAKCVFSAVQKVGRLLAVFKLVQVAFSCVAAFPELAASPRVQSQVKLLAFEEQVASEQQALEHKAHDPQ